VPRDDTIVAVVDEPGAAAQRRTYSPLLGGLFWAALMVIVLAAGENVPWPIAVAVAIASGLVMTLPFAYWARARTPRSMSRTRAYLERAVVAVIMGATFGSTMGVGVAFDAHHPVLRTVLRSTVIGVVLLGSLFFFSRPGPNVRSPRAAGTDSTD
jgi:hypothetical protein